MDPKVIALVLAGGEGKRLWPLTRDRSKPAVPFGGIYRLIDFVLSNLVNAGYRKIAVLTQYKSHSLDRHLALGWSMSEMLGNYVTPVPAQMRRGPHWFSGSADAIFQNFNILTDEQPDHVIVFGADHIYRMDPRQMVDQHIESGAAATVAGIRVPIGEASDFGVIKADEHGKILSFLEKPEDPPSIPGEPDWAFVSMGNYVFNTQFLYEQVIKDADTPDTQHDFGRNIIPRIIDEYRVFAYPFRDPETSEQAYWRDVGTVDAYFRANLELVYVHPELNLYDSEWPIWTYQEQLPPAKFVLDDSGRIGMATNSMVSGGCIVSGAYVKQSLLFSSVTVDEGSEVIQAVILPQAQIGRHCRITRAIIDKRCVIPDGMQIGVNLEEDRKRFHVTPNGIVLVTPNMLGQDLYSLEGEGLKWMPES